MPVKIYSGIKPPDALVNEMTKRQGVAHDALKVPSATPASPATPNPLLSSQVPPRRPSTQSIPPVEGGDIPDEPPPSYEDAMAEDLAPADGPRVEYEQTIGSSGGLTPIANQKRDT